MIALPLRVRGGKKSGGRRDEECGERIKRGRFGCGGVRDYGSYADVKKRIVRVRGQPVIIDADVAELYGVQVKRLNEQVRRNLERFPESFMFQLTASEINDLKSQIATSSPDDGMERLKSQIATSSWGGVRKPPKAFTEKGLYMLATVLKSKQATAATFAIIETFAKVRGLKRELVELHKETGKSIQSEKMRHFGDTLAEIVMPDLDTVETESSLELNFFIGKIKHTVRRVKHIEPKA